MSFLLLLVGLLSSSVIEAAAPAKKKIILASSNVTTGPASQLGLRLNQGAQAYFERANREGLLDNYQIDVLQLDDSYEPFKTVTNTQLFLEKSDLFGFINYVGTPTTSAAHDLIKRSALPFLTPFTGAEFLRTPVTANIFNLRASYFQEAQAQIDFLIKEKKLKKIGLLIQADAFGYSVEAGYIKAMKGYGVDPIITTRYRRNTDDIETAMVLLKKHNVEAVAFVGTYHPFSQLVNKAFLQGFTPYFTSVSFVSSKDLFPLIQQNSQILITEVMPSPAICDTEYCRQFKKDMGHFGVIETDRIQLEGYLNAFLFVQVAKQCLPNITPSCFLNKIKTFSTEQQGLKIKFSTKDHQGLSDIYLNFFSDKNK